MKTTKKQTRKSIKEVTIEVYLEDELLHRVNSVNESDYKKIRNIIYRILVQKLEIDNIDIKKVS